MHPCIQRIWRRPSALIVLFTMLSAGCAHESFGLKMESNSLAREFGFPQCSISPPMSQEAVLAHARNVGNPDLASFSQWKKMVTMERGSDNLRLVDCLGKTHGPHAGEFFYALFRDGKVIASIYPGMFD